tara:strand:+ start:42 stop:929 length:888 start_codon:yes stop_codon:yes gene_type:complete
MIEFIIVFRETLEASLIVGIIYTLLLKNKLHHQIKKIWLATFSAIIASIIIAFIVLQLKEALGNNATQALFEGIFMYITAGFIYYVVFWISKHLSNKKQIETKTMQSLELSSWGIFILIFFAILREGFETAIFLISSFSMTQTFSYTGFISGAFLAILIGYLIVIKGKKIKLNLFFKGTTLFLIIIASGMIAYGTHEIESYLVKSNYITKENINRPWNILEPQQTIKKNTILYQYNAQKKQYIHILHDKGNIGVFLKGFLGYNSNPNYIELILWLLSLLLGLKLWKKSYRTYSRK